MIIYTRPNGTFVVDGYHVIPNDPMGKYDFAEVAAYAAAHPEEVAPEPPPPEPSQAEIAAIQRASVQAQLDTLDRAAVRPLRAIAAGAATDEDRARLAELEAQAEALRATLPQEAP